MDTYTSVPSPQEVAMSEVIPVVQGFKAKVTDILGDERSSPKELFELLVLQPLFIVHLFKTINAFRQNAPRTIVRKPHSVAEIIDSLGYCGVERELRHIEEVSPEESARLFSFSADIYAFACVFTLMAENEFGRIKPPAFFLYGILSGSLTREDTPSDDASEPLEHALSLAQDKVPDLAMRARSLIETFKKASPSSTGSALQYYTAWRSALRKMETIRP